MSRRNGPRLDLKLNLSPPRGSGGGRQSRQQQQQVVESPSSGRSSTTVSPTGSCVSSELVAGGGEDLRYSSSPETTSMVLVGCPRCLMYVMLSEEDPRCPKCKSTVLLDVAHQNAAANATANAAARKNRKN